MAARGRLACAAICLVLGAGACGRNNASPQPATNLQDAASATASSAASAAPPVADAPIASSSASAAPTGSRTFSLVARLTAPKGAFNDRFGEAIALDGGTLAVGAPYRDDPGLNAGVVYVFQRDGSGYRFWQTAKSPKQTAHFGAAVALMEGKLLASRDFARDDDLPMWFERRGDDLAFAGTLERPSTGGELRVAHFGNAFVVRGDHLLVAARGMYAIPGRAFLYHGSPGNLTLERRFDPEMRAGEDDGLNYYMGHWITFDDRHVVLAAVLDTTLETATVIFRHEESGWRHQEILKNPVGGPVALSGSLLLVGAYACAGPVTVYREEGDSFRLVERLGKSMGVAAEGDLAALSSGVIHRWDGAHFVEVQRLSRKDGQRFSGNGPVVLRGDLLAIGEPDEDGKGAVYVFEAAK